LQQILDQGFSNKRSHDPTYGNEYNRVNRNVIASLEMPPETRTEMWNLSPEVEPEAEKF